MLPKVTLGIDCDCDGDGLKLVALGRHRDSFSLAWHRQFASQGALDETDAARVRQAVREQRAASAPALAAVPADQVAIRRVELPAAPREKQRQMLGLEIAEHLPFRNGSAVFDLMPTRPGTPPSAGRPTGSPGGMQTLLLVGAPDGEVARLESWGTQAGLRTFGVSARSLAAARALEQGQPGDTPAPVRLVLDFGAATMTIIVADGPRVLYARTALTGGADLCRALAADGGLDAAAADQRRRTEGLSALDGPGTAALRTWVQEVVAELRSTLLEYSRLEPLRPPVVVCLTGDYAATPALDWVLHNALDLPVALVPAPPDFDGDERDFAPLVAAYGLALLAGDPPEERVVLWSHERVRITRLTHQRRQRTGAALAAMTAALVLAAAGTWSWRQDRSNRDLLRQEVKALQSVDAKRTALGDAKQRIDRYAAQQTVSRQQRPWLQVLASVSAALPEGVWLTTVSGRRGQPLQVEGRSLSNAAVAQFADNLSRQPTLAKARLDYSRAAEVAKKRVVDFSIRCELSPLAGPEDTL